MCLFIFAAYAYGATTVLAFRQMPVWGRAPSGDVRRAALDPVLLTLCGICTIWFVLHAAVEFRVLIGRPRWEGWPDLIAVLLSYTFPPLVMHNVLNETDATCMNAERRRRWTRPVRAMYAASLATGAYMFGAALHLLPRPQALGAWSGMSIGLLFTVCSVYCIALMLQRKPVVAVQPPARLEPCSPSDETKQRGLRRTMIGLFFLMIPLFFALIFVRQQRLVVEALNRVTLALPMFFLVASVYFENRFEFYDLIVKRAAMLFVSLLVVGGFLAATLSALEQLPSSAARPWLFAVVLLPLAMILPWLHAQVGRWLDRMWFGREFTSVEAVKQVLSAMHPATDEATLIQATEARLSEMFHTQVQILVDDTPAPPGAIVGLVGAPLESSLPVRFAVVRRSESRPLLSEDMSLLRSLASVFAYMLENIRLQRRRQEQDQVARDLRLQTSRSELKALRAQINPHFLFNALNAIASLIHTDPTRADAAVEQLAEVFRYTLRRSEQEWAPLDQELAFARAYLDVEQARFGHRLTYTITATPAVAHAQVPSMLLHTLVENGVKHGISQVRGAGRIDVDARSDGDVLVIDVRDNGPGPHNVPNRSTGESFGLRSVRDRLRGHFGERATLSLSRDEALGTTVARIDMPLVVADKPVPAVSRSSREGTLVNVVKEPS